MLVPRLRPAAALALALTLLLPALAGAQSTRVRNGYPAGDGQYPWTVALVNAGQTAYDGQFCGGTLVAADVVVTAAHCVWGSDAGDLDVAAGLTTFSPADPRSATNYYDVDRIALHEQAQADPDEDENRYDAAVLHLAVPVTAPGVVPIGLTGETVARIEDGVPLTVTGWGVLDGAGSLAADLQVGDIPSVSDTTCENSWGDVFHAEDMMCALAVGPPVIDSCKGDSGGPLTTRPGSDKTAPAGVELVGIVSFGSASCAEPNAPGVYVRVAAPQIHRWFERALDGDPTDLLEQPRDAVGQPSISDTTTLDQTISCGVGSFAFDDGNGGAAKAVELLVRRIDGARRVTVNVGAHHLTPADDGKRFVCQARGRTVGAGGYVARESKAVGPVTYVPPSTTPPPGPPTPNPTPNPTPAPTPTPPVAVPRDTSRPTVTKVSRRCTRKRSCTLTISAKDGTGPVVAGVTAVQATLTSITTRTCKRGRKRVRCARTTTRTVHPRKRSDGRFTLTLKKLPKGRHTVSLQAVDGAGNLQRTAYRVRFTLK